jgi:hypothetical protein
MCVLLKPCIDKRGTSSIRLTARSTNPNPGPWPVWYGRIPHIGYGRYKLNNLFQPQNRKVLRVGCLFVPFFRPLTHFLNTLKTGRSIFVITQLYSGFRAKTGFVSHFLRISTPGLTRSLTFLCRQTEQYLLPTHHWRFLCPQKSPSIRPYNSYRI